MPVFSSGFMVSKDSKGVHFFRRFKCLKDNILWFFSDKMDGESYLFKGVYSNSYFFPVSAIGDMQFFLYLHNLPDLFIIKGKPLDNSTCRIRANSAHRLIDDYLIITFLCSIRGKPRLCPDELCKRPCKSLFRQEIWPVRKYLDSNLRISHAL